MKGFIVYPTGSGHLRSVSLSHNALGSTGCELVLKTLPFHHLTHLDLSAVCSEPGDPMPLERLASVLTQVHYTHRQTDRQTPGQRPDPGTHTHKQTALLVVVMEQQELTRMSCASAEAVSFSVCVFLPAGGVLPDPP